MAKLKLMTIVGTRPEIIRLSEIIKKCDKYFDQVLVHTGQNYDYELNEIFFEDLGIRKPDHFLNIHGGNLGEDMGNIITSSYKILSEVKPDALMVLGDTNSCLSAISAKRLHIPVFHLEAGNRCFDECLPEETNRKIVDHVADVNLCYSEHARRNLITEGRDRARTFVIGSPMPEVLSSNLKNIESSDVLKKLNLESKKYMLLSAHREENIVSEENFHTLFNSLNEVARIYDMPILYSCHPRANNYIEKRNFKLDKRIIKVKPLSFRDYNKLQTESFCVISDSGTLPEETDFYTRNGKGFASVCIRTSTERPEALEKGRFVIAGLSKDEIINSIELATNMNKDKNYGDNVNDYTDINISDKVVKIIQSYTHIVDKFTWRKF